MAKAILIVLISVIQYHFAYGQSIKLITDTDTLDTRLRAITATHILTTDSSFHVHEIYEMQIANYEKKYDHLYQVLKHNVNVRINGEYLCQYIEGLPINAQGILAFEEVIDIKATKRELYFAAKHFITDLFKADNFHIIIDDQDKGHIFVKAFNAIYPTHKADLLYAFDIELEEGRYKYHLYDIYYKDLVSNKKLYPCDLFTQEAYLKKNGKADKVNEAYKNETIKVVNGIISHFKSQVQNSIPE